MRSAKCEACISPVSRMSWKHPASIDCCCMCSKYLCVSGFAAFLRLQRLPVSATVVIFLFFIFWNAIVVPVHSFAVALLHRTLCLFVFSRSIQLLSAICWTASERIIAPISSQQQQQKKPHKYTWNTGGNF